MGRFTSPIQLAARQKARFAAAGRDMEEVHEILATSGRRDFISQTGGRISSKSLRAMGHPFARNNTKVAGAQRGIVKGGKFTQAGRAGQVKRNGIVGRLPINKQTGRLRRGLRLDGPSGVGKVYRLYSNAPHAKYVLNPEGTDVMVPRGLLGPRGVLRKRHQARVQVAMNQVRRSLRKS